MKNLIFIPDTGVTSAAFYKIEGDSTIFWSVFGSLIFTVYRNSDSAILEQVTIPSPGVFVDVLASFASIQRTERFDIGIARSTGGSSALFQSGALTHPNPGYSTSLAASVVRYP